MKLKCCDCGLHLCTYQIVFAKNQNLGFHLLCTILFCSSNFLWMLELKYMDSFGVNMYERSLHMIKHDLFWGLEGYEMFLAILPSNLWLAHLSGNSWWLNRTVIAQQTFCIDMSLLMRISQNCTRKRFLNIWAQTSWNVMF